MYGFRKFGVGHTSRRTRANRTTEGGDHEAVNPEVDLHELAMYAPQWMALFTTAVAAMEGALIALKGRSGQWDIFGVILMAGCLGLGGGVIRDVMVGQFPVAAVTTPWFGLTVAASAAAAILLRRRLVHMDRTIVVLDGLTLGFFASLGTGVALAHGLPVVTAVFVGGFSAVGGGVLGDILRHQRPSITGSGTHFLLLTLLGAIAYAALEPVNHYAAAIACISIVFATRVFGPNLNRRLTVEGVLDARDQGAHNALSGLPSRSS